MKSYVLSAGLVLASFTSTSYAGEWEFLPVTGQDYQFGPAVALMVGQFNPKNGDSSSVTGVELSIECPLLKPPSHHIRQQISITQVDDDGLTVLSVELSPHHMFRFSPKFEAGFGPSLGLTKAELGGDDATEFAYGLGASARFDVTPNVFVGAELRKVWMGDVTLDGATANLGNTRAAVKMGYQF